VRVPAVLPVVLVLLAPAGAHAAFPAGPPDDPRFDSSPLPNATSEQWNLASPALGFDRGISADRAWRTSIGTGVVVADLDSGADFGHEDLAGQWATNPGEMGTDARGRDKRTNGADDDRDGYADDWRGYDVFQQDGDASDDARFGHGTNTAGVIAAAGNNGKGIIGVAPGARILMVRVHDSYIVPPDRLAQSIVFAVDRGASVVSMSLGTTGNSPALRRAVAYAERRGVVLVAAMGNEFFSHREYPAAYDGVIAVGGVTYDTAGSSSQAGLASEFDVHATFSNYGPHIDVAAPTVVPSTSIGNRYTVKFQGTSASTPHVAGVVALVIARARTLGLTLSPGEIRQIIRAGAHDVQGTPYGLAAGWDRYTGYGRLDALGSVQAVAAGRIPPAADLVAPAGYSALRAPAPVRARISARAYPVKWTLEAGQGVEPAGWQQLGSGTLAGPAPAAALGSVDPALDAGDGVTLRLRVTDAAGNAGEDRGYVRRLDARALAPRYPLALGASGEASPQLAQLDGRPGQDIVLGGGDGIVRVISGRTGRTLPGWPRALARSPGFKPALRAIGATHPGVVGTPAIADLDGDHHSEIVVAGGDGSLSVFDGRGRMKRGFPVRIDIRRPPHGAALDAAILASPAIGDLDGDGKLDIVVGAADQKIYAWSARGRRLPGWPVLARDGDRAKILSSPAIGDIDGDHRPDVVEGTAEVFGDTPQGFGRVYAFSGDGRRKPGWPVKPDSFLPNALPLAGEGVPTSPTLADVDGDGADEVAIAAVAGEIQLYRGNGSRMGTPHFQASGRGGGSDSLSPTARAFVGNGAFGRPDRGGPLRYFSGEIDGRIATAGAEPGLKTGFDHLLGGWDARSGALLGAFPRKMEGWFFLNAPVLADVDGSPGAEIVVGSSGGLVHAYHPDGTEASGWPRDAGGWLIASPAVGDVDGDGLAEVVQPTRDGSLFVWDTPARARANEWPFFRHDQRNTGRYTPPR
jgi:hypothetical protein